MLRLTSRRRQLASAEPQTDFYWRRRTFVDLQLALAIVVKVETSVLAGAFDDSLTFKIYPVMLGLKLR